MRMAVSPELAKQAEVLEVTGRDGWTAKAFRFGPYQASDKDNGWGEHSEFQWSAVLGKSSGPMVGAYSYKFRGPGGASVARCGTERITETIDAPVLGELTRRAARVECQCQGGGLSSSGYVEDAGSNEFTGRATVRGTGYTLASTARFEGGVVENPEPTGFEVRGANALVAAAEVVGPGRVWLSRALDDSTRAELACLLAGLMFYDVPDRGK
jgi:hypothetical protein